jgi:hypothetical protein
MFLALGAVVAAKAKSVVGSATFNVVALTNVVERSCPFQKTTAPGTNPLP